ncbi:LOW QUALITY PROTEIN: probable inactive poly [ADP-ribose] polymerase SRO3 [Neltuma alba]|uniref:LOW QUALITY PROTEIN: probable inactive poly [ADP-ribose] polymerase SRO3 n=1 Tax=Neltuma alba TaxID=207710 RepID=UPI0010A55D45|nr:LOW QUALITY PROTEIN: probable inactive poly [ADP-ribose] polymerase SRO3 [Prosopis alba]
MNQTKMAESVTVRVPLNSSLSSLLTEKANPVVRCSRLSDSSCARLMIHNHSSFKRSAAPDRFMFYRGGSWVDFQSQVLEPLRAGFLAGKPLLEVIIGGSKYVFDFLRMVQIDFGSGSQRSIAWIDEDGKPFFPHIFVDEYFMDGLENSGIPKIEVEIRIDGISGKRKLDDLDLGGDGTSSEVGSSVKINKQEDESQVLGFKRQRLTSLGLETSKWPNAKLLSEKENAYSFVSFIFLSEMSKAFRGVTISSIHQFEFLGPLEKDRSEIFERHNKSKEATRGVSNAVYAWYAASAETVAAILAHGFVLSEKAMYPAYGIGIHLSPLGLPQLSAMRAEVDNNGEKHIILCRVILGKIEKVTAGSQQCRPSSVEYDTGADDPLNPKWYVLWSSNMNSHILPEYVISFKSSAYLPGQLGAKNTLVNLLRKMNGRIPSLKLKEIITLYRSALAGKLAKEIFLGQLRAIVGDELLISIFHEMRCSG